MTTLTDVRDRTINLLRALGVDPDQAQMRVVERYVRWVDAQIADACIKGRELDADVCGDQGGTTT